MRDPDMLLRHMLRLPALDTLWKNEWGSLNGWLYMISYFMICVACLVIPFIIGRYLFRRQVNPYYTRVYLLFGAFILATGVTFFLDAVSVWKPIYRVQAVASLVTGIISVVTLVYLFKFLPKAFSLRLYKKREERKKEERFRILVEEIKDYAILMIDAEGRVTTWNKGAEAIEGYTADEVIGKHISMFFSKEEIEKKIPEYNLQKARETGRYGGESKRIKKGGAVFWCNFVITPLYDHSGQLYGYSKITRDVTERKELQDRINQLNEDLEKRIEEKTREVIVSERRFRALVENSHDAISLLNEKFEAVYRSPVSMRVKGSVAPEGQRTSMIDQVHPDDRILVKEALQYIMNHHGEPYPISFRTSHKDGDYVYAEGFFTNMLHDESVQAIVTNLRDVTERKRIEEALRKTFQELEDYKNALDKAVTVLINDPDGIIKHVNDNFCETSKYTRDELIGQHYSLLDADGRTSEQSDRIHESIASDKIWKGEMLNKAKDGRLYWEDATIMPFHDIDGKVYQYISIRNNITDLKMVTAKLHDLNSELENIVEQRTEELKEANKAMESFSYSVSHDLRAPLRIIDGYADILLEDHAHQLDDEGKRILDIVMNNARRMGKLIDALLNLSRLGRKELSVKLIDMNMLVKKVIDQQIFPGKNPVEIKINELLPSVGDPELLEHVWGNLISNALKYSSKVNNAVVKIDSKINGEEVIYSVQDNGVGFDMKYAEKLFGVFQRLHKVNEYEGTGIGLALVQRIVQKNGGRVWAESEPDKGAVFYFSLPANQK
jgi:PAS domain S-box-containing protein